MTNNTTSDVIRLMPTTMMAKTMAIVKPTIKPVKRQEVARQAQSTHTTKEKKMASRASLRISSA